MPQINRGGILPAPPQFLLARALALFSPRPAFALGQKETTAGPLRACCGLFSAVCIPAFVLGGLQRGRLPLGFLLLPWTVLVAAPHPYRKYKACFGMGEERCTLAFCHLIYLLNACRTTGYPSIAISFF